MSSVRDTAERAIREGLGDRDVLRRVFSVHPAANISTETIAWYRERMARAEIDGAVRFAEIGDAAPAPRRPLTAEPATAKGKLIRELLRDGLPDYVVYRRSGAVSLASVRAHRARLIGSGEAVPTEAEARQYWVALGGAPH